MSDKTGSHVVVVKYSFGIWYRIQNTKHTYKFTIRIHIYDRQCIAKKGTGEAKGEAKKRDSTLV